MQRAMDAAMGAGQGHDYTYLYPGLRKVVQAAGAFDPYRAGPGRGGADG
jgi:hypothetical protein